eukprot:m.194125 g.194125  ORF g.194125 m.194125 type:complete len:68 (-) comp15199_c0_seq4:513-716(-)
MYSNGSSVLVAEDVPYGLVVRPTEPMFDNFDMNSNAGHSAAMMQATKRRMYIARFCSLTFALRSSWS